jgi:multicomponent Na+:H+ antiporter subunit F
VVDPFLALSIAILFTVSLCLYRALKGPGIVNRIISVNVIGTKTIALILLIGTIFDRVEFFVDIAFVYALINFISTLAFSKYLDLKGIS